MRDVRNGNYVAQVKEDILDELKNWSLEDLLNDNCGCIEDVFDYLCDEFWNYDNITGNASGSYFFDCNRAKQMVLTNIEDVVWAMLEFDCIDTLGRRICEYEWEWLDVTARCYHLHNALREAMNELGWLTEDDL